MLRKQGAKEGFLKYAFLSGADSDAEAADAEKSMMRRLGTYHELFLDVPDAGMWGNPVTLGFTPEELAPPVSLEQFDPVLHSLIFQVQQTPAPEGKNGVKNKELFLRFLNGFSQYARLGRVRFRTEGGSAWAITVEEAREKFRDFWYACSGRTHPKLASHGNPAHAAPNPRHARADAPV